ncbi:MAG TPA: hypothetical protein VLF66_12820 [Thermoanaerobaculia bacterium]|nr:hypothetical protein [Thermoanaerobaculia bacterium]
MSLALVRSRTCRYAVLAAALALAAALPGLGQEDAQEGVGAPPQMILVHEEKVKPPMLDEYVDRSKEFFAMVQANRDVMPTFAAEGFQTDQYEFVFALPLSGFAQMDTLMGEFMAMAEKGGAAFRETMKAGAETTTHFDEYVILYRTDLSHHPAEPRVPMVEATVYRWDFYYLQPDMEMEAEQIARDVAALYREKEILDAYGVFQAVLGSDMPFLVVSVPGRSVADIETRLAEIATTLGDAWPPIQARIHAATRDFVSKYAWARPDLSLAAPTPEE